MGTHDALHKAREVGASISQSTDNEVGALLSRPTQIDCPTFDQLGGDEESLLVSLQRPSPYFSADAFRCGSTVGRRSQTSIWPFAERKRAEGQDAQPVIDKRLQRQLQELRSLMGSEPTKRLRRVLRICPQRKGTFEKKCRWQLDCRGRWIESDAGNSGCSNPIIQPHISKTPCKSSL